MWVSFFPNAMSSKLKILSFFDSIYDGTLLNYKQYGVLYKHEHALSLTLHKRSTLVESIQNLYFRQQDKPHVLITQSRRTKHLKYFVSEHIYTKGHDGGMYYNFKWVQVFTPTPLHLEILDEFKKSHVDNGLYRLKI